MGYGQFNTATAQPRMRKGQILAGVYGTIKNSRLLARNTAFFETMGGRAGVRLHDTTVVEKLVGASDRFAPGSIHIDSGGWNTLTTRDRINMGLELLAPGRGLRVWTHRGVLYLHRPERHPIPFKRTITIGPRGGIAHVDVTHLQVHRERKLVDDFMRKVTPDAIEAARANASGDPFIAPDETGRYPESSMLEWLKSGYLFWTLICQALHWTGNEHRGIFINDVTRRSLRRYIMACLGYASS